MYYEVFIRENGFMIKLSLFQKAWDLVDINPYGLTVDAFLRMVSLDYSIAYSLNTSAAPRSESPYIIDEGKIIGDSNLIIDHIKQKYQISIDDDLTSHQNGISLCLQRMLESHIYPIMLYSRMLDNGGWEVFKRDIFNKLPTFNTASTNQLREILKIN